MKFLLTNDDGIEAPGLAALERALADFAQRQVVVAPVSALSGCSHQATTRKPLRVTLHHEDRHAVDGTPVDCARIGLAHVMPDADWVVAGINAGGNLGADVYMSGTVAAVREAALLGRPGIAVSQYVRRLGGIDWDTAARWTAEVIQQLIERASAPRSFWNVNLPDCDDKSLMPPIVFCTLDPHPMPIRFHAEDGHLVNQATYQERHRAPGCDVDVCFGDRIAVTELKLG